MSQSRSPKSETVGRFIGHETRKMRDIRTFRVSLNQWRMLHAVVDCGSFANAAEYLHVTQPAISHTIARVERLLGLPLLQLEGRKSKVTEPGSALLERSRFLLWEAKRLEEFAEDLRHGARPAIQLAVDKVFPTHLLLPALGAFSRHPRNTKVHLSEVSGPRIEQALRERATDLAIFGSVPPGFHGDFLTEIEYVAVAHPEHPLFRLKRELTQADMDFEVQVVSNAELATKVNDDRHAPGTARRWHVTSFDTAEKAIRECLVYGWLPKHRIQESLDGGNLKILPLRSGTTYKSKFYLVHGHPSLLSSETRRLVEALHSLVTVTESPTVL